MSFKIIECDLFESDDNLVHCVSQDFHMGAGIALTFKSKFGHQQELRQANVPVGKCAVLTTDTRKIFYLVTKTKYWHKPTYKTLRNSLTSLATYCDKHQITTLSMPKIGCGLDRLSWSKVRKMIQEILINIDVTIYSINLYKPNTYSY